MVLETADSVTAAGKAGSVATVSNMPWNSREFVVKDCDGRLLAFGASL